MAYKLMMSVKTLHQKLALTRRARALDLQLKTAAREVETWSELDGPFIERRVAGLWSTIL